ncbi:MAG TPA: HD domain-containing protein [Candidatus Omnitrophica bacterium]|nr:HD domain-containing protein [Candidatus Omnitrophota bacterium]
MKLTGAIVSYPENKVTKGMDLIELADHLLNKAKESGGNRVYTSTNTKRGKQTFLEDSQDIYNVKSIKNKIDSLTKRAYKSLMEEVYAFTKISALKDGYTEASLEKSIHYAAEIARRLQLPQNQIEDINRACLFRGLGKIAIDEKILHKDSGLTNSEFDEIKKYPQLGVDIIRPIQFLHDVAHLILCHHERMDGSGYPCGFKKETIPLGARIVGLVDVYQAITSDRPYRKARSKDEAIKIIKSGSETQFDSKIVGVFLSILQNEKL